ncbi:hypothetical protein GRI58_06735 [Porphyrobacter algicida]|uniref:Phytoene synthase n=1 Tax=Qipengyuania algicida TaxID=1836209 RepID=A0A845AIZ5_9SPHN|nr:hypothetical protein [Qipengyuania algicida]MXP28516.1 hypothetical protein [Qipengyuania algicida]
MDGADGFEPEKTEFGEHLAPEMRVALSCARAQDRGIFAAIVTLDQRLSAIGQKTREPIFAQMRMAWWRDEFAKEPVALAREPLLAALRDSFPQGSAELTALVDGWEALLLGEGAEDRRIDQFIAGRAGVFALLARRLDCEDHLPEARIHGALWAMFRAVHTDFSRDSVATAMKRFDHVPGPLPRRMRPLAVLGGLSARALRREASSLLGDRLSPLVALRLSLFGR